MNGIWIVAALVLGILGVVWLLERIEDARQGETGTPPLIRSLHRDRSLHGGASTRYTSEGRAIRIEPVRRPRIGRQS